MAPWDWKGYGWRVWKRWKELGFELFPDRMAEPWHREVLAQILKGRTACISFHAPFRNTDMPANGEDETFLWKWIMA